MRTITINDITYKVDCSALTYLYFDKIFMKSIFDDIDIVKEFLFLQLEKCDEQELIARLDSYIGALNRLTYIAIYTNKKNVEKYEEWIKSFDILDHIDCIKTIVEVTIDCFIDEKVSKELERINKCSGNDTDVLFPEHYFLSACLKLGLTMKDLENLTYIDVLKIFLSIDTKKEEKPKYKIATQADWDRLANSR